MTELGIRQMMVAFSDLASAKFVDCSNCDLTRSDTDDFPEDVVAADFFVSDSEGNLWRTTSRFTAELFVSHLIDFSSIYGLSFWQESAAQKFQEGLLLEKVRYSSDDRFFRAFCIEGKMFNVQFRYTTMSFDIASVKRSDDEHDEHLLVKINKESLFTEEGDDIGELSYVLDIDRLLCNNTAVYSQEYGCWQDSPIPLPLVFESLPEKSEPQSSVTIEGGS